jgi:hypothetical protein
MMAMFMSGAMVALAVISARIELGAGYVAWYLFWAWAFWKLGRAS